MMVNQFRLPTGITADAIIEASAGKDSSWRRALLLALPGKKTAQEIADEAGMSRSMLFRKRKEVLEIGLKRSFQRKRGGGRKSEIKGPILDELRAKFATGNSARDITKWLSQPSINIQIDLNTVYYWRRKLGFTVARSKAAISRSALPVRREDVLNCVLDTRTRDHLQALLATGAFNDEHRLFRGRRILEALSLLDQRTTLLAAGKWIPARQFARRIKCSPKLLYRVAALFRKAGSDWNRFVELAYSKAALSNWKLKM